MTRKKILSELIDYAKPASQLIEALRNFPWDSSRALVTLESQHLLNALRKFINGDISKAEIEDWANAIECRDDIEITCAEVRNVLHELANPILTEDLTPSRAMRLIEILTID